MLRRSAGLSQEELAAGRFSKEYVSQIERGKTRPTPETLEWIAGRLDTDREFLEHGVSRADAERLEAVSRRPSASSRPRSYEDALARSGRRTSARARRRAPAVALRLLRIEAWIRIRTGELERAMSLLEEAATLAVSGGFTDVDRADVVFGVGVVRYSESKIGEAIVLFGEALVLADGDGVPADRLRSDIYHWRARCHRRNRDWVAAAEDIERALELADASADARRAADALFQASLVAQRQGRWVLARTYAERARDLFDELGDRATVGRLLNNLAGLEHLLGDTRRAIALLDDAFALFVDLDLPVDAGYVCSSLAEVRLESGDLCVERDPGAEGARAPRRSSRPSPGGGDCAAHARPGARGSGTDRGSRAVHLVRRPDVRAGALGQSPQLRLDSTGRRREHARRRSGRGRALSPCGACATRRRRVEPGRTKVSRHALEGDLGRASIVRCR